MLTPVEHEQQIYAWNRTATDYPRDQTVHALFERQAAVTPDAIAIEFGSQLLSYAELNQRANRVAHYLVARGVTAEVRVGLFMERSLDMVVALLGILKAGGAYVPLDLEYPSSRIAFMLEDSQAIVLLSMSTLSLRIPDFGGKTVLLDRDWSEIEKSDMRNPEMASVAENLAYVIYTSGSTGTPKGVEIQHRAISRLVKDTDYYQVDAADRILQASNVSFDAATFELWGALLNGACLVGISKENFLQPKNLAAFLKDKQISVVFVTTAVFNQIARETPAAFGALNCVMFGGEAADCDAVRRVVENDPPRRLLHVYGPTESTTFASWYLVTAVPADATTVPIGYPLANTTLYVLDEQMQLLPPGVPGELYIGGDGLARGYLNRPWLTAERFVENPFASGQRLYKTGDRVRYGGDGAIEFIGRFDNQVKLRGFRIEPGEVESVLRAHAGVDDAVVTLRPGPNNDRQLVAYIVTNDDDGSSTAELISGLRRYLEDRLPRYMLPGIFMPLDALPLTPNGKIDRHSLPQPDANCSRLPANIRQPRTETEQKLAAIWAEVLGLDRVGTDEQFLDLGGHSLLATRVVTRIREDLGIDLSLADFYREVNVSDLASRIENMGPASFAIEPSGIRPVSREQTLPVSFSQEQVIFLNLLTPDSLAYNTQMSIGFVGNLDTEVLERALNEIVRRHEIFRTSFDIVDGVACQKIHPDWKFRLPRVDLSELVGEEREARMQAVIADEIRQRFDIGEIPLIRWKLLKLEADEHLLLQVEHHLVHDGWSFGVFTGELQILYDAYSSGQDSPLPELPIQYADYVMWQRQRLQGERLQTLLDYWKSRLAAPLPVLQLPTDFQRPPLQTHRGAEEVTDLSPELADRLRELSLRENSTLYVTALSIFYILLHKYSGQADIIVGTGVANRGLREVEGLIGMFVNAVPLRADLSGDPDFHEVVRRVHEMAFEAYEYQELPLEKLVGELPVDRDLAYNPLFQVLFSFHDSQVPALEFPELTGAVDYIHNGSAKFDLNLVVIPWVEQMIGLEGDAQDRRITIKCEYATDLFTSATVRRMLQHFENLLAAVVAEPGNPISKLSILGVDERHCLLEQWNRTSTLYPRDQTVHALFEQQAAETPDAIAVEYEGKTLSYAQLNRRANQLAHYLGARGVTTEITVGVCIERSLDMIVGLLGILKAGGVYLPLDPDYPQNRLDFMLKDAGASLLLTQSPLLDRFRFFAGETICLDSEWSSISKESRTNPAVEMSADNLIYIIYTSGSTGRPKGTLIEHRGVVRLVRETNYVDLDAKDVFLQFAPLSFDASTFEIWGSLLNGARLVVFPAGRASLKDLSRTIEGQGISILWLTSALFSQMVDEYPDSLSGVKQLLAGGEALSLRHVTKMLSRLQDRRLINGYGPTENTTFTCCHVMASDSELPQTVPIGRPISNTTVYILDDAMQPVPIGAEGELYIGGDGLARGYLNQPELTAEKFVPDPFSHAQDARLYRTGDRVRYRPDASIEFIGRIDQQLKLRGFRIEPGEIETLLGQHKEVRAAVVVVREHDAGDRRLIAYVVPEPNAAPDPAELRSYLRASLPDYMRPSAFVVLEAFPLTANGKLDRDALPLPQDMHDGIENEYAPPRNQQEQQMVAIWSEVLKLDHVGIHDNFFDLGGHSLLATQVVSRVRQALGVELPLSEIFSRPTLAQLSPVVAALSVENSPAARSQIEPVSLGGAQPLSFAQERLWFLYQLEPESTAYNVPLAIRLRGDLSVPALTRSLRTIVQRQQVLRTRFVVRAGKPVQVIDAGAIELPQEDLSSLAPERIEAELAQRIDVEAVRQFELSTGPLLRCRLLRIGENEQVLILAMHHIVADGWSFGVFFRELGALYAAFCRDLPDPLPPLTVQYVDFAQWQRQRLSGDLLQGQLDYWRQQLEILPTLELPTDRPRPSVQTYNGAHIEYQLDRQLGEELGKLERHHGVTPFMSMLAAFGILLQRYTRQQDIVVGTPIANRNQRQIEDLVGFFVNSLVLRLDLSGEPDFVELLQRVKSVALDAYEHQDLPFESLVEELQPERDRSRNPLFQVLFVMQNAPVDTLALEGLTLERMPLQINTTHFDLELHAWHTPAGPGLKIAYNTDLFDASTIERMFGHYENLLGAIVADPRRPVSQLPMMTAAEQQQILEWNRTAVDYGADTLLHRMFERQAAMTPDNFAVDFESERLSYAELNRRANLLACYLQDHGVGPEVMVGLHLERSLEMVVALLGVLKAGGAYVPLDPDYPVSRLEFMLRDTRPPVLLSQAHLAASLPAFEGQVLQLDRDWGSLARYDSRLPLQRADCNNLAYVIYTSGSTGHPKGVMNEHRGIVNRLRWMVSRFPLTTEDRVLQKTPYSFDVSIWEFFWPLVSGAELVVAKPGGHRDPAYLAALVAEREVSAMHFVPSMLRSYLAAVPAGSTPSLKWVFCSGEALPYETQQRFFEHLNAELHNLYGPTEAAIEVSHWLCRRDDDRRVVPIGRPTANTQLYILDRELRPVAIGIAGELHIGGLQVARGYLNQAELSSEKFIRDPFAGNVDARLYRTGDLARFLPDGNIEYLGRIDNQVKLRGFRIELGEIETVLSRHPAVEDAAVILNQDATGNQRLLAYVVAAEGDAPSVAELREILRQNLPDYMLPSAFFVLDELPMTASGKLDRRALPSAETPMRAEAAYIEPHTALQRQLAEIWRQVLGVEKVGLQDNFFDLGGHSLMLVELHSRLRETLDRQLSVVDLFAHPTVAELAQYVGGSKDENEGEESSRLAEMNAGKKRLQHLMQHRRQDDVTTTE